MSISTPDDIAFIADAWVQTARGANRERKSIPRDLFFARGYQTTTSIASRVGAIVATAPGDPSTLYGFLVIERRERLIHFWYVKKPWRGLGIGRAMLARSGLDPCSSTCTWWTRDLGDWVLEKYKGLVYNPYVMEPIDAARAASSQEA